MPLASALVPCVRFWLNSASRVEGHLISVGQHILNAVSVDLQNCVGLHRLLLWEQLRKAEIEK